MSSLMQKPYLQTTCTHCKIGHYVEDGQTGEWWLKCNECNALLFCYNPMDHQADFHADDHKFKMFAG